MLCYTHKIAIVIVSVTSLHPMYWSVPGIKLTQALLELPEVNTALQYAKININKIKRKQRRNGFR